MEVETRLLWVFVMVAMVLAASLSAVYAHYSKELADSVGLVYSLSAEELKDDNRVNVILRNARRITRLANDILDVSRIESNTFKVKTTANVVTMIQSAIEDASARIPEGRQLKIVLMNRLVPEWNGIMLK